MWNIFLILTGFQLTNDVEQLFISITYNLQLELIGSLINCIAWLSQLLTSGIGDSLTENIYLLFKYNVLFSNANVLH